MRLLSSYGPWIALLAAASFSSVRTTARAPSTASEHGATEPRAEADAGPHAPAPATLRVQFDLVPTYDGLREVLLDVAGGRRFPLGELPAGATCDARVEAGPPATLRLLCGSGLDAQVSATANALAILGDHDVRRDSSRFSDDLPLPPGTQVELDATLHDPAPPPSCAGTSEKAIDLVLEDRRRFARPHGPDDVHLRASFGPLDMHVEAPRCEGSERTCVGRGDSTHHHYEYLCTCGDYPDETSTQLHVWDRIAYAIHTEGPPDTGRSAVEAVWSVPCGARLRYPPDTRIVNVTDDHFELTPAQERAREQVYAMEQALNAGIDAIVDRIGR